MSGWQILGLVLIVLFLIGQIRVGVGAEYAQEGLTVRARLGWIKIKVFPLKKQDGAKPKKKKAKKEKAKKRKGKQVTSVSTAAGADPNAEQPVAAENPENEKGKAEKTLGEKVGGGLDLAEQFLPLALEAAGCFWNKLVMDELELCLTAGGSDPADTALLYGHANAAMAALWEPITNAFHVKDGHAQVRIDFDAPGMTLYGKAALSLKIGQIMWLAVYFGVRALVRFIKYYRIRKAKEKARKAV